MSRPLNATTFAAARFSFLEAVADDAALPKIAARLAVKLAAKYMRAETGGEAWPSIRTLCGDLSVSADSAVRKALWAMVAAGHLEAEPVAGGTTRYRIAPKYFAEPRLKNESGCEETPPTNEADTPPIFEADTPVYFEAGTPPIFEATITGHRNPDNESRTMRSGQDSPPTPSRRRKRGGRDLLSDEEARIAEEGFERFWSAYPRKVDKADARKAFARALAEGAGVAEITLGAMRYAAEREREPDPHKRAKFTAHAATWLNKRRWENEPEPAPAQREPTTSQIFGRIAEAETARRCGRHLETALAGLDYDDIRSVFHG